VPIPAVLPAVDAARLRTIREAGFGMLRCPPDVGRRLIERFDFDGNGGGGIIFLMAS